MSIDWPALCRDATQKSPDTQLHIIRSSFGTLAASLLLVAAVSLVLCARFYRIPKSQRVNGDGSARVWPLYVLLCNAWLLHAAIL